MPTFFDFLFSIIAGLDFEMVWLEGRFFIRVRRRPIAVRLLLLDEQNKEITMAVIINSDKKRTFSIKPVDSKGRPASVDGVPEWSVAPEGGVSLFPAADGMSCDVVYVAALAGQVLTVQADADLGAGSKEITGTADLQTLGASAVSINLSVGEEVDA